MDRNAADGAPLLELGADRYFEDASKPYSYSGGVVNTVDTSKRRSSARKIADRADAVSPD